jgi:hypothetical protein
MRWQVWLDGTPLILQTTPWPYMGTYSTRATLARTAPAVEASAAQIVLLVDP